MGIAMSRCTIQIISPGVAFSLPDVTALTPTLRMAMALTPANSPSIPSDSPLPDLRSK